MEGAPIRQNLSAAVKGLENVELDFSRYGEALLCTATTDSATTDSKSSDMAAISRQQCTAPL